MAKTLLNTSTSIQFLKLGSRLYNASIRLNPAQSITLSDSDYRSVQNISKAIQVTHSNDSLIDSPEEVQSLINQSLEDFEGGDDTPPENVQADGPEGALQFNAESSFAGSSSLLWDNDTNLLTIDGDLLVKDTLVDLDLKEAISVRYRALYSSNEYISINWEDRALVNSQGTLVASWHRGLKPQILESSFRPPLNSDEVGVVCYDDVIKEPIWFNGYMWSKEIANVTLTAEDLTMGDPALEVIFGGWGGGRTAVIESVELVCFLNSGTPYTTTANLYLAYSDGNPIVTIPLGDTTENGNKGVLTNVGVNRRFCSNLSNIDVPLVQDSSVFLHIDDSVVDGTEDLKVRIIYKLINPLI